MSIMQAFIVFAVGWWVILFIALPIGVKTAPGAAPGHVPSAPINPNLRKKFKWVTVASLLMTALAYFLLNYVYAPV